MLPSGDIHILAQSGVSDSLEDLEPSQYFDGVGGQREAVAPADIMRQSRGKEGKSPQLGISQGPHHARLPALIMTKASHFASNDTVNECFVFTSKSAQSSCYNKPTVFEKNIIYLEDCCCETKRARNQSHLQ